MSTSTVRWAGVAGMLGGALFVLSAVVITSLPRGCIGDECAARPMRETGAAGALLVLALLLVVVGMAGLVIRARNAGRLGALGKTGAVVAAVGAALPVIGGVVQGVLYGGDYPLMPYFVIPGVLALVVGFVLLGVAVLLAGVLPRWAAALLVVGSLAMLGFNDQNAQALLAIPNGIAWIAVGFELWSGETAQRNERAR
ncbi:MAG TPA: hypothetical protein VHH10_15465 [Rubrobacteraceae bacterium]|nr:hypothetical protein [Rubrobacteraceae bacterium]